MRKGRQLIQTLESAVGALPRNAEPCDSVSCSTKGRPACEQQMLTIPGGHRKDIFQLRDMKVGVSRLSNGPALFAPCFVTPFGVWSKLTALRPGTAKPGTRHPKRTFAPAECCAAETINYTVFPAGAVIE